MLLVTFKKVSRIKESIHRVLFTSCLIRLLPQYWGTFQFSRVSAFLLKFYHYDCILDSPIQVKANVFSSYLLGCCRSAGWSDTSGYGSPTRSTNHFSRHFSLLSSCIFGCICTFPRFHLTGTSLCIDLPSSTSSNKHQFLNQHYHNRVVDCNNLGYIFSVSCVRHLRIQILHGSLLLCHFVLFGYYLLVLRGNPSKT